MENVKESLINWGKEHFSDLKKGPTMKDLEEKGYFFEDIRRLFGSLDGYLIACGFLPNKTRKRNMTVGELKNYLEKNLIVTPINYSCPSFRKPGTVCFEVCTCKTTDLYWVNPITNRQVIYYEGATWFLAKLVHFLYHGLMEFGKQACHECDNPICINKDHIMAKTPQENMQDCVKRGRHFSGRRTKSHNIKNIYNVSEVIEYVKNNSTITTLNEWLWKGRVNRYGYPSITFDYKTYLLPRLILANKLGISYEDIGDNKTRHLLPDGKEGQKHDVNPDHLHIGTAADNSNDRRKKWDLSKEDIDFIFEKLKENPPTRRGDVGAFDRKMGRKFKVSKAVITRIRLGDAYKIYLAEDPNKQIHKGTNEKPIVKLDLNKNLISKYTSIIEAAKNLNYDPSSISKVCLKKRKTASGYIWMFEDDYVSSFSSAE